MKKVISTFLLSSFGAMSLSAAVITSYSFNDLTSPNDVETTVIAADSTDSNVTDSGITGDGALGFYRIGDVSGAYSSDVFIVSSNDNVGSALTAGDHFFSFTITPDVGATLDLDSLTFDATRGGTSGTREFAVRSSLTGTTNLLGPTQPATSRTTMTSYNIDLSGVTALQDITSASPVEFRFYIGTGSTTRSLDFDDIVLNGTTVVPEPSSYALLAGALALGWVMLRRRG